MSILVGVYYLYQSKSVSNMPAPTDCRLGQHEDEYWPGLPVPEQPAGKAGQVHPARGPRESGESRREVEWAE